RGLGHRDEHGCTAGTDRSGMRQGLLATVGSRAGLQGVQRRKADIGHEMIGRRREARPDHALGLDTGRTHEPRPGVGQMLLAIGAVEFRAVLGDGIENEQMSRHGMFLSFWGASRAGYRWLADMRGVRNPYRPAWARRARLSA